MKRSIAILLAAAATITAVAATPQSSSARGPVYYTDFDSGPAIRPLVLDGNANVRSGPFRHWRGWGTSRARATVRRNEFRTTVIMRQLRRCAGRRQYHIYSVYVYEGKRRLGRVQRFVNRACK